MFSISPLASADIPDLARMIHELAEYERLASAVILDEGGLRDCLLGSDACARALLARSGCEVVGYAVYFFTMSTFLGRRGVYIEDIYVRPAFRGRGLGRALFARVAESVVAQGCARLEWSVLDWNTPAITFYEAMGAASLADWTMYRMEGDALAAAARPGRRGI